MRLGVIERLTLLQILPQQGDFLTLRIIHELRQALSFTEDETVEFGLEVDAANQRVRWEPKAVKDVEIPIGPKAMSIIVAVLTGLGKDARLIESQLPLYEKFCTVPEA